MPRVHTRTKTDRGKTYTCSSCGEKIEAGQSYYYWSRRFGRSGATYYQHHACGYPRPTQLSSRKTAAVVEAISAAQNELGNWSYDIPEDVTFVSAEDEERVESYEIETDAVSDILSNVAEEARGVASEYEDGVQNLPENFQQAPTGEAMTTVSEELNEWADNIDDWDQGSTTVDVPDPADYETEEAWQEALQEAHDNVVEEIRGQAESVLEDMPEYAG